MVDSRSLLLAVITILTAIFVWSRRTYVYWQRRRIRFVRPTHILGNLKQVLKQEKSFAHELRDFYFDERFRNEPVIGIYLFHQPALLIKDLELVRTMLIEDFVSFSNRFGKCDSHGDKLGALNLFFVKNPEWRDIRTRLSPVFSSGKIKQMFELMEEIGYDLEEYLNRLTKSQRQRIVEIKEICDLYTTDLIASIAFGFRSYSLRNKQTELGRHCRELFRLTFKRAFSFCVIAFLPKFVTFLRPKLFTPEHSQFLRETVLNALKERDHGKPRNDLIELLITLKKEADLNQDRSNFAHHPDYLVAHAANFELGGLETCAGTLAFALYELAKNPEIQNRLRDEIQAAIDESPNGFPSYDKITNMQYLGMVVDETLRKYPIVPFLERECTPVNRKRFYSLRPQADCMARRGMAIYISNLAIHHDPKYWTDPERFDPDRFAPENRDSIKPMSYLPFGTGPRGCVGIAIGLLQIKLGLIHMLREHHVETCEKTVSDIKHDPKYALLANEGGIYLRILKLT